MYYSLPVKDRMELMKHYKNAYPKMSYHEMIDHFNTGVQKLGEGGPIGTKENPVALPEFEINAEKNTITNREDFKGNFLSPVVHAAGRLFGSNPNYIDLNNYYSGYPTQNNRLKESNYKPTNSKNKNTKYISLNDPDLPEYIEKAQSYIDSIETYGGDYLNAFREQLVKKYGKEKGEKLYAERKSKTYDIAPIQKIGKDRWNIPRHYPFPKFTNKKEEFTELGNYQIGKGKDKSGNFTYYYDLWDTGTGAEFLGASKPFEVYDRVYKNKK